MLRRRRRMGRLPSVLLALAAATVLTTGALLGLALAGWERPGCVGRLLVDGFIVGQIAPDWCR